MKIARVVAVALVVVFVAVLFTQWREASSGPCRDLGAYGDAILNQAAKPYIDSLVEAGMGGRESSTYSTSEMRLVADKMDEKQTALKKIKPPSGLEEWHQYQIEITGFFSSVTRTWAESGAFAGATMMDSETGDRLISESLPMKNRAVEACSDFAPIWQEWVKSSKY